VESHGTSSKYVIEPLISFITIKGIYRMEENFGGKKQTLLRICQKKT